MDKFHHQDFQVSLHNMTYSRFKAKSVSILISLFSFLESVVKMKTTKYNNNQRKPSFDWVRLDGANVISTVVMFDSINTLYGIRIVL